MRVRALQTAATVTLAAVLVASTSRQPTSASAPCLSAEVPAPEVSTDEPAEEGGAPYYAIPLVSTKKLPGTARASGTGAVTFTPSPFGLSVDADGSYGVNVRISLRGLRRPVGGRFVAWATTPQLDDIERLGALDDDLSVSGEVVWNQFLLVITLEDRDDPGASTWSGPIAFRGVSRSGMMHTMAGHGPFQQELCAKYGY